MMDCVIRSRISPVMKKKAVKVFDQMGLTLSEAIRLFIYQSVAQHKIPFSINIPNEETQLAMEDAVKRRNIKKTSLKKLGKDWDAA